MKETTSPILEHPVDEPAVFRPEKLLQRAATMMGKEQGTIPACCILDFDGELVAAAREIFRCSAMPDLALFSHQTATAHSQRISDRTHSRHGRCPVRCPGCRTADGLRVQAYHRLQFLRRSCRLASTAMSGSARPCFAGRGYVVPLSCSDSLGGGAREPGSDPGALRRRNAAFQYIGGQPGRPMRPIGRRDPRSSGTGPRAS